MKEKHLVRLWFAGALLAPSAALAAASDWAQEDGARIRLVAAEPAADANELRAALQIELKPGWKTYWRNPGDAGVPPQLNFDGSTNIAGFTLHFPVPVRFDEGKSVSTGYTRPVAFPITLKLMSLGKPTAIRASAFLGICDEICVPVQLEFNVDVPVANASTVDQALVTSFFDALPGAALPGFEITSISRAGKSLTLMLETPDGKAEPQLFVAADGYLLGTPKLAGVMGKTFEFTVPIAFEPKNAPIEGADIHYTAVSGAKAVSGTSRVAAK